MLSTLRLGRGARVRLPTAAASFSTQVTRLPSGLTVATQKTFDSHSTINLHADVGSRDEAINGESRLLERLMKRGITKARPQAGQLAAEVEGMGGLFDLEVGKEQTKLSLTSIGGESKKCLEILKDVCVGSSVDGGGFEAVKKEATDATFQGGVSTQSLMMDRTYMNCFRDSSLGNTFYPENFSDMSHQSLKQLTDNYVQDRLVISAAGNVDHNKLVAEAQATFGDLKPTAAGGLRKVEHKPYFLGAMMNYRNDEMGPLCYLTMAWQTVSWRSSDALTFMLIAQLMGEFTKHDPQKILPGSLSGNRFINNHSSRGHGVGCIEYHLTQQNFFRDTGLLTIYAVCDEVALNDTRSEIQFALQMMTGSLMDEEVERAKRELKLKLQREQYNGSTVGRADTLGKHVLGYGRFVSAGEMAHRLDDLTSADVRRAAYEYLHDSELAVCALGPTHGMLYMTEIRQDNMTRRY